MSTEKCMYDSRVTKVTLHLSQKKSYPVKFLPRFLSLATEIVSHRIASSADSTPRFSSLTLVPATIIESCEIIQEHFYGSIRRRRHHLWSSHSHRKISGQSLRFQRPPTGRNRSSRGREAGECRSQAGGRVHHGQRGPGGARSESRASGRYLRRTSS